MLSTCNLPNLSHITKQIILNSYHKHCVPHGLLSGLIEEDQENDWHELEGNGGVGRGSLVRSGGLHHEKTVLVTFTWPEDMHSTAFWARWSGQVDTNPFHLAGEISKICLRDTCRGWCPGQVNVTGKLFVL